MSGHLVRSLSVGGYLPIGLPQGDFIVPESTPVRPLFITAGSGVTPVMSMLRTWHIVGNMPDAVHVHYAPHRYDVIFGSELEQLAERHHRYRFRPVLTRDGSEAPAAERHFSAAQLDELCPDWAEREVWACGPQSLLADLETHFDAAGRGRFLHIERFRAALADCSGRRRRWQRHLPDGRYRDRNRGGRDHTTAAHRRGRRAHPEHGCRMGICHTCDVPLVAGRVRDLRTGELIDEPGRAVQICISGAAGDCELELTTTAKEKALPR